MTPFQYCAVDFGRQAGVDLFFRAVVSGYRDEISEYAKSHGLRVIARDMGYSTQLGLLWRSWIVK